MNWKELTWKNLAKGLGNSLIAIARGEFLMRLRVERFFPHIVYLFFLVWMLIWIGIKSESTQLQVEKKKAELQELEIVHSQKVFDLVSLSKRSSVRNLLEQKGSKVTEPTQPATLLVK